MTGQEIGHTKTFMRKQKQKQKEIPALVSIMQLDLYTWRHALRISLGSRLLLVRNGMNCRHEEMQFCDLLHLQARVYSVWNGEALGILHRLVDFCHCDSMREVFVITDHKPLEAKLSKEVATLSQQLQCILQVHQYRVCIIYSLAQIYTSKTGWPTPTTKKLEYQWY